MQPLQRLQIFIGFIFFPFSVLPQSYAVISGKILNARKDSLSFIYNARGQGSTVKAPLINDSFYIRLMINSPGNIDITDGTQYISGLIEPNDSIIIKADFGSDKMYPQFTGRGKGKFLFKQLYKPLFPLIRERITTARFQTIPSNYLLDIIDSIENSYVEALTVFRPDMSEDAYLIFKGDLEGVCWQLRSRIHLLLYNVPYEALVKRNSDSISAKFKQRFESFLSLKEDYRYSGIYTVTVAGTLETLFHSNHPGREDDIEFKYNFISEQLPAGLQVPVLSRLLNGDMVARRDKDALASVIAITFIKPEDSLVKANFTKTLNNLYSISEGGKAPDFVLENQDGKKVHLSDYKGKVVYMDFWFADCPPCHQLFKQLKPVKENFKQDANVVFLNISIDNKEVWLRSLTKFKIEGQHLFTEGKETLHPIINDYQVFGYPTNRIISKTGEFFIIAPSDKPKELIEQINAALKR